MKTNNEELTKFDRFEKRIDRDQYLKNRALKQKMKRYSFLDVLKNIKIPNLKDKEIKLVSSDRETKIDLNVIKNPIDTFGIYSESWNIQCDKSFNGVFFIKFTDDELKQFKKDTVTLFYYNYDEKIKNYQIIRNCIHQVKSNTFGFKISKNGTYSIIGLPNNYIEQKTISVLCEFRPLFKKLSPKYGIILKNKICELIRCIPDNMHEFRSEMDKFLAGMGQQFPSNPCDSCIGMPFDTVPDLPACHIDPNPEDVRLVCQTSPWENLGPFNVSGCIKQVKIVPINIENNTNRVYALSHNGGLWVLDESQTNAKWKPLSDNLDNITMKAFDIAKSDPRVIYVANKLGQIHRSNNSGISWSLQHDFVSGNFSDNRASVSIQIHSANPRILYLGCSSGFYKSVDWGVVWNQLRADDITDFVIDPDDNSIIYLCVSGVGVFKSYDSGSNWDEILNFNNKTTDPFFNGIKISLGFRNIDASSQSDSDRSVAVLMGTEVVLSNDGGNNWNPVVDIYPPKRDLTIPSHPLILDADGNQQRDGGHQGDWCYTIAIDPYNQERILVGHKYFKLSINSGITWNDGVIKPGHEDQQYICFDRNTENVIYIANDGGIFKTTNGGNSRNDWTILGNGLITAEFYRVGVHGNNAVGNMYHQGLQGTFDLSNQESSWERANLGEQGLKNALEFSNVYAHSKRANWYFLAPRRLLRLKFPGSGANGDRTRQDLLFFAPKSSEFSPLMDLSQGRDLLLNAPASIIAIDKREDSNVILCCCYVEGQTTTIDADNNALGGRVMKTREGDNEVVWDGVNGTYLKDDIVDFIVDVPSWTEELSNPSPFVCVAFSPQHNGIAYAMTLDGQFFVSDEVNSDTTTWTLRGQWRNDIRQFAINHTNENIIYAISSRRLSSTSSNNRIGVSIDGGITWVRITFDIGIPINTIIASPYDSNTIYLGTDMGVFASFNDGEDWVVFDDDVPNVEVTQIFFEGGYLYAVTHGRGLWRKDICRFTRLVY